MMVVITMSCCPMKLRGDLTRWLIEIDTGVYVGNLSARVRDAVWERICENIKNGRASMAYGTNGEQKVDFRIHNTNWEPVDYDGIKLVRITTKNPDAEKYKKNSKASVRHMNNLKAKNNNASMEKDYVVIDIETTGLHDTDRIIEIGALKVVNGEVADTFECLVNCGGIIPKGITELTGITNDLIEEDGIGIAEALERFRGFCGESFLIGHNIQFDMNFLRREFISCGYEPMKNRTVDTVRLCRKKRINVRSHSLTAIADITGIKYEKAHRALKDCEIVYGIYEKLKEI